MESSTLFLRGKTDVSLNIQIEAFEEENKLILQNSASSTKNRSLFATQSIKNGGSFNNKKH